jgi:hypothetical protein
LARAKAAPAAASAASDTHTSSASESSILSKLSVRARRRGAQARADVRAARPRAARGCWRGVRVRTHAAGRTAACGKDSAQRGRGGRACNNLRLMRRACVCVVCLS